MEPLPQKVDATIALRFPVPGREEDCTLRINIYDDMRAIEAFVAAIRDGKFTSATITTRTDHMTRII